MLFSNSFKMMGAISMAVVISNVPALAMAEVQMIPTQVVVDELSRAEALNRVNNFLSRTDVQKSLVERGVSAEEAALRVASLSEVELNRLSGQIEQAKAGGDILVAILLVVLIIFLIKRI
ncbi:MAG: PA2779 family protein [Bdellovibrio sp.]